VANAIYTTTRDELAGLVSRQVASGMLSRAVASVGSDPTTVDASTMSRLLRGRVRRELERTLPRAGVRRRLADLDARLAREHGVARSGSGRNRPRRPDPAAAPDVGGTPAASTPSGPGTPAAVAPAPVGRPTEGLAPDGAGTVSADSRRAMLPVPPATVWTHEPADTGTFDERRRAFPIAGDVVATRPSTAPTPPTPPTTVRTPSVPTAARAPSSAPRPAVRSAARPSLARPSATPHAAARPRPDRLIERMTDDDAVRQWIWSPAHGPPEGRGAGPDPGRVATVLGSLTTVLSRHGAVRSLHVRHGQGHVMMGVDRGSTLVIAGDEDLNLGAVYASFRALEEEP